MHKFGFALTSSVLLLASAGAADAGCIKKGQGFRTELRPTVNYFFATDNGRCGNGFTSGSKTVFTSASIVTTPEHGKLEQIGRFRFRYRANPGYKGEDRYAVKICGTNRAGSGCATLIGNGTMN